LNHSTAPKENTASKQYRIGNVFSPRMYGFALPLTILYEHLLEPVGEPPPELWFSEPRFSLQIDLCLVVGFEKRFRSVQKCAPKVRSFSGPKIGRTRWAPIMGAHLVLPKMRPEFDPSLWATTLPKSQTRACTFLGGLSTQNFRGGSWSRH